MTFLNSKRKHFFVVLLLIVCFVILITFLTEFPFIHSVNDKFKKERAVIAIRDNVIPFQKMGTRLFTFPYLSKYYDTLCYFTQYYENDKKTEFISSLNYLLDNYSTVDVFLLAHSNNFIDWINELDSNKISKIRLVYNTGCSGYDQTDKWKNIGVKSYVSHIGNNSLSPVFYFFFLRRWCSGLKLKDAVNDSNNKMKEKLFQVEMLGFNSINEILINNSTAKISGDSLFSIDSIYEKSNR
ncbi:MAG: hypothetical protein HY951_09575 [Bacteroidia bacterium]|nr:hypothetical protein [Bacteroidia bacterium]